LTIGFDNDGARNTVQMRGGKKLLAAGFNHVLGIQPELDLISGTSGGGSPKAPSRPARPQPEQQAQATPHSAPPQQPAPSQQPAQQQSPAPRQESTQPTQQASVQPPTTGVAGWGAGRPDQTWGQPEHAWDQQD